MKYPAIYQSTVNGNAILLFSDKQGVVLNKHETVIGTSCGWIESAFKNITAEYLANTYGEVKSKEHAEFIKLLADTNKIPCAVLSIDMNYTMFYVIDGCLFFCVKEIDVVGDCEKITIPLPSECESVDEWPKVGSIVTWGTKVVNGEVRAIDNGLAWIKNDHGHYVTAYISELEKPKTPKQELRDFISLLWDENNHDFDMFLDIVTEHVIKKPQ